MYMYIYIHIYIWMDPLGRTAPSSHRLGSAKGPQDLDLADEVRDEDADKAGARLDAWSPT